MYCTVRPTVYLNNLPWLRRLRRSWLGFKCPWTSPLSWPRSLGPRRGNRYAQRLDRIITRDSLVGVQAASDQEAVGLPQGEELAGTENIWTLLSVVNLRIKFEIERIIFKCHLVRILPTSSSSHLTRLWRESLGPRGRSASGCRSIWRSTWSTPTSSNCDASPVHAFY